MFFKLTLLVLTFVIVSGTPEFHHYVQVNDGVEVNQDIFFDEEEQIVIITVSPAPQLGCQIPTINFHDYKTGYVAFKDVNASKCYISRPPIGHMTPDLYRMKKSSLTMKSDATVDDKMISPEDLKKMAGERIYEFCLDYASYKMELKPHDDGRKKRSAREPCYAVCGICLVSDYDGMF